MGLIRTLLDIAWMVFSRYIENPAAPPETAYYPDGERA